MKEDFIRLVEDTALMVRKRNLRGLGKSAILEYLPCLVQNRLGTPIQDCSSVMVGNMVLEVVIQAIEKELKPEDLVTDTPNRRIYVYLTEFIIQGKEWKIVAEDSLHVSRSTFYEIQQTAFEALAIVLWELESEEVKQSEAVLNNLGGDVPYTTPFIERFDHQGKSYVNDIIIPLLKNHSRPWFIGVIGDPGVGKSSIAFTTAVRCVEQKSQFKLPFDVVIWFSFKSPDLSKNRTEFEQILSENHTQPLEDPDDHSKEESDRLLSAFFEEIGKTLLHRHVTQLSTVEQKRQLVEEIIKDYVCLFVIDNLDSDYLVPESVIETIFEFVYTLPAPHKALLTLRKDQSKRPLRAVEVKSMNNSEAQSFLKEQARTRSQAAFNEDEFRKVYEKTQGNPLAMRFALGAVRQLGYKLDEALDFHTFGKEMLDSMYGMSYVKLPVNAKKILMVMPIFSDRASREAIEQASGITGAQQVEMLGRLYLAHMIERTNLSQYQEELWYSLLPFPREFVFRLWEDVDLYFDDHPIAHFINEAHSRLANYYIERLTSVMDRKERALALLRFEKKNIDNIFKYCSDHNDQRIVSLLELIGSHLGTFHIMDLRESWGRRVVQFLKEKGDLELANWYYIRDVAWAISRRGIKSLRDEGRAMFEEALVEAVAHQWQRNIALALTNLGRLYDDAESALKLLTESRLIFERLGEKFWLNVNLRVTADYLSNTSENEKAIAIYKDLVDHFTQTGDFNNQLEAESSLALALAYNHQGEEGVRIIERVVQSAAELIPPPSYTEALAITNQARIYKMCKDAHIAKETMQKAITIYGLLGMTYWSDYWREWMLECN